MKSKRVSKTRLPYCRSIINTRIFFKIPTCWMMRIFGFCPVDYVVKSLLVEMIDLVKTAGQALNVAGYSRDILWLVYVHVDISDFYTIWY